MEVKAKLRFYRQSPKKVRQLADLIRGLDVQKAQAQLLAMPKRAARALGKLLDSAVANAENNEADKLSRENLFIKEIRVDQGPTYKRQRPRARGSANLIRKRTSHISIVLGERDEKTKLDKDKKIKSSKDSIEADKRGSKRR